MSEFGRIVRQESKQLGEDYEPSYKEILRAKYDAEWAKFSPEMQQFAEYANDLSELFGFTN